MVASSSPGATEDPPCRGGYNGKGKLRDVNVTVTLSSPVVTQGLPSGRGRRSAGLSSFRTLGAENLQPPLALGDRNL
ncbi:hypothetical protein TNCV_4165641 [Trichonephila clavipes]|nr:hypothetical protein TNCV_4165641 [Trichonephila clavipes]